VWWKVFIQKGTRQMSVQKVQIWWLLRVTQLKLLTWIRRSMIVEEASLYNVTFIHRKYPWEKKFMLSWWLCVRFPTYSDNFLYRMANIVCTDRRYIHFFLYYSNEIDRQYIPPFIAYFYPSMSCQIQKKSCFIPQQRFKKK